jgi:hypothetical protein
VTVQSIDHDRGIRSIAARGKHVAYGMGLGIMLLDDVYPGFPGDVRNASAFPFPIQYDIVEGVDIQRLVFQEDKTPCLAPILAAAKRLERMGCRAIAAECGYFAYFQKEVARAVSVPVFMSSLLQVPLARQLVGADGLIGIVCGTRCNLTPAHLEAVGIDPGTRLVIAGAMDDYACPEFDNLWNAAVRADMPVSQYERSETDLIALCKDLKNKHPEMRALVFECTGFQPFARAVQREVDLPIFTWSTLLDYAYSVVVHRDFYGHV